MHPLLYQSPVCCGYQFSGCGDLPTRPTAPQGALLVPTLVLLVARDYGNP